jgi:dipeptidyl aminopeptidase/acylaminoacyl peptidase
MRFVQVLSIMLCTLFCLVSQSPAAPPDEKPPITLDEFFNSVAFTAVEISPDGGAVVVGTELAAWDANRFREDLWLYRDSGGSSSLVPLTQSGHDDSPQWSPDAHWIAFLSDRSGSGDDEEAEGKSGLARASARGRGADHQKVEPQKQLFVIRVSGGEAFPVTKVDEGVHSFAWSGDSHSIFFSAKISLSKKEKDDQSKEWKDVIRFREQERGDSISRVDVSGIENERTTGKIISDFAAQTHELCKIADRAAEMAVSPDGNRLAIRTEPRSERHERLEPYAIYVMEVPNVGATATPRLVSHDPAVYDRIRWATDSRHVFFSFLNGSAETPYSDAQARIYWVDAGEMGAANQSASTGAANSQQSSQLANPQQRWAHDFTGSVSEPEVLSDGSLWASGRTGTEVQPYTQRDPNAPFTKTKSLAGTYEHISAASHSPRLAFVYSTIEKPAEVFIADSVDALENARPITSFNKLFTERAMPQARTFKWTADDGASVEGELIYPPGHFGEKNLKMFTLIHGGPEDADGNHFEADWYQWAILAATDGWLVFEPNYRGSIGYGDKFALGIIGPIVSRPGKDILEGVDALVKDGTANPNHLTVGGYSYGGYMTNWLITQTTRFKAAVTGAGAAEHVANWGNDDTTFDDAYFLGGAPWEAEKNYNAEAAIWQFGKVTTPTHVVGGAEDIRVYIGEDYLLERALYTRGVPCSFLIFPGEGHSLDENPWHGKIKVRDELQWLEKYGMR